MPLSLTKRRTKSAFLELNNLKKVAVIAKYIAIKPQFDGPSVLAVNDTCKIANTAIDPCDKTSSLVSFKKFFIR